MYNLVDGEQLVVRVTATSIKGQGAPSFASSKPTPQCICVGCSIYALAVLFRPVTVLRDHEMDARLGRISTIGSCCVQRFEYNVGTLVYISLLIDPLVINVLIRR